EKYPAYGNLVPRDIATREIFEVCVTQKRGIMGRNEVYLDITHLPREVIERKLGGILEIYLKFVGEDPREVPMRVFPAVHYSMGGLWVDYERTPDGFLHPESTRNQMTNIAGLYAAGECEYQYHGANRLGANALLSCIFGGETAGNAVVRYVQGLERLADSLPDSLYESERRRHEEDYQRILRMTGDENPYRLHQELGEWMTNNVTVVRYNDRLMQTEEKILELMERWKRINIADSSLWTNQVVPFTRALRNMLVLAQVITRGALLRNESRGAHYKPEYPQRNDAEWLKTTMASYTPDGPRIFYEEVDTSLIPPRVRKYDVDKKATLTTETPKPQPQLVGVKDDRGV
ncbi:MAG: FAD-binding protein, partial [Armatimonadota bacterium]|nr:FAD-binding protein [Armatimonadota bacterium]